MINVIAFIATLILAPIDIHVSGRLTIFWWFSFVLNGIGTALYLTKYPTE